MQNKAGERLFVGYQLPRAKEDGAVCLDGSPAVSYFRKGVKDGLSKWLIVLEGGSWCQDLQDCSKRLGTDFGSSRGYVMIRRKMLKVKPIYLSDRRDYNRMMWNWNQVFLRSCDGGAWVGGSQGTVAYNKKKLHFRGATIMRSFVDDLFGRLSLGEATDVVMLGITTAAAAIFTYCDPVADRVASSSLARGAPRPRVVCALDNGLNPAPQDVADFPRLADLRPAGRPLGWYRGLDDFVRLQNATANAKCLAATGGNTSRCLTEFAARYVETPIFAMQGLHDEVQLEHILGSPTDFEAVNSWIAHVTAVHRSHMLEQAPWQWHNALFLHACHEHKWSGTHRADLVLQTTAFEQWYYKGSTCRNVWIGDRAYPCLRCCAPNLDGPGAPKPNCTRQEGLWAQPPANKSTGQGVRARAPPPPRVGPYASEDQGPYGEVERPALEDPRPAIAMVDMNHGLHTYVEMCLRGLEIGRAREVVVVFPLMAGALFACFLARSLACRRRCPTGRHE